MAKWHSIQDILKNILQLSANTHHDVAVFEVDGIYKKHYLKNGTSLFQVIKKFLNCPSKDYIFRTYFFQRYFETFNMAHTGGRKNDEDTESVYNLKVLCWSSFIVLNCNSKSKCLMLVKLIMIMNNLKLPKKDLLLEHHRLVF